MLVMYSHIYGKCFSSFGLEANKPLQENIFIAGGRQDLVDLF